jgi:hypothetical protein
MNRGENAAEASIAAVNPLPSGPIASSRHLKSGAVRLLLVDDHAMFRQGLRALLDGYADIDLVGEAADGE